MDSLLIAIIVAVVVWLLMRHARTVRARQAAARAAASAPTMPRVGTPGTITPEQLERMKALHFDPSPHWSKEEADLVLDAVAYLRAVVQAARGEADPPIDLQNRLLVFILTDEELRAKVAAWGEARRAGKSGAAISRDACFERVAAAIQG